MCGISMQHPRCCRKRAPQEKRGRQNAHRGDANVGEGVLRGEADIDGEECVGGGGRRDDKLHGAGAVGVIDEVDAPQQRLLARVVVVVPVHLIRPPHSSSAYMQ